MSDEAINSNLQAADAAAARLLREIDDLETRLGRVATINDGSHEYLIKAYRRNIEIRHRLLADLPEPMERAPNPWH